MIYPNSSHIQSSEHDPATNTMHVTFKNGQTYRYDNVPPEVHEGMTKTYTPGKYFHNHIRKGNYKFTKL